jgi:asparaginyl-tRNA synthetase
MEAAAMALGRVYCFGPTFRAEKSKTRRHLNEFWMIEPEMAFCDLEEDILYMERFTAWVVERCLDECSYEFDILERDTNPLKSIVPPFPRMRYEEVVEKLNRLADQRREEQLSMEYGQDLGQPHEDAITEGLERPLFITHWPKGTKAFYMKEDPENPDLVLACDMIAPEKFGELIGGSQREDDYDKLEKRIEEHRLPKEAFRWYLDLRTFGSVPHSGFGLGLERTLQWITGTSHIRETIPYPRTLNRIYP